MLAKLLKLFGNFMFLIQFTLIMLYQYYKYWREVVRGTFSTTKNNELRSPMEKVNRDVYSSTGNVEANVE